MKDKKLIYTPESKIEKDKVTIYGAGKFGESELIVDRARAAVLCIELLKFLNLSSKKEDSKTIDEKIAELRKITTNFLFIEYYSHEDCDMYKILNEYTNYREDKFVLCSVEDGIEKALDLAIESISRMKKEYYEKN